MLNRSRNFKKELRLWNYSQIILIVILLSLTIYSSLSMYAAGGAEWDFLAHWLGSKSFITPAFYTSLFEGKLSSSILYGNAFYFESLRAPLESIIMIPFVVFGNWTIPSFFIFSILFLLASTLYFAKVLEIDPILPSLFVLTPYVALFLTLLNGTEILSMSILLFALALLIKKDWKSGILFAIAGLAKYTNLIFMPLILFLPKAQRKKALLSFVLTTLPWIIFNTIVFHNPLFSYLISTSAFSTSGTAAYFQVSQISASLWMVLSDMLPLFALFVIFLVAAYKISNSSKPLEGLREVFALEGTNRILLSFLFLGALAWVLISAKGSISNLPRLGYMIYLGIGLLLSSYLVKLKKSSGLPLVFYQRTILLTFILLVFILFTDAPYINYQFYGSSSPVLGSVGAALKAENISRCNLISNNWVYLIYDGYKAHLPYYYNSSLQCYPIIFFTDLGSNQSSINFANVTNRVNYTGFFIAFPKNYSC